MEQFETYEIDGIEFHQPEAGRLMSPYTYFVTGYYDKNKRPWDVWHKHMTEEEKQPYYDKAKQWHDAWKSHKEIREEKLKELEKEEIKDEEFIEMLKKQIIEINESLKMYRPHNKKRVFCPLFMT